MGGSWSPGGGGAGSLGGVSVGAAWGGGGGGADPLEGASVGVPWEGGAGGACSFGVVSVGAACAGGGCAGWAEVEVSPSIGSGEYMGLQAVMYTVVVTICPSFTLPGCSC